MSFPNGSPYSIENDPTYPYRVEYFSQSGPPNGVLANPTYSTVPPFDLSAGANGYGQPAWAGAPNPVYIWPQTVDLGTGQNGWAPASTQSYPLPMNPVIPAIASNNGAILQGGYSHPVVPTPQRQQYGVPAPAIVRPIQRLQPQQAPPPHIGWSTPPLTRERNTVAQPASPPSKDAARQAPCIDQDPFLNRGAEFYEGQPSRDAVASKAIREASAHRRTRATGYTCITCGQDFTKKHNLDKHERSHRGEKPNVCPTCGAPFNGKSDLDRHVKNKHPGGVESQPGPPRKA